MGMTVPPHSCVFMRIWVHWYPLNSTNCGTAVTSHKSAAHYLAPEVTRIKRRIELRSFSETWSFGLCTSGEEKLANLRVVNKNQDES